ncbi:MAG TPA: MAPEG family protein [Steroidobacteraceae bacterium]|nr:MAPEG family protein [Steroidobacteraceae bacterium]
MTPDLKYLVWAVALTIVQLLVVIIGATTQFSIPELVGNRETALEARGWVGRAQRAHRNMLESLVLFATLVLVAHVAGRENNATALGAAVFFYARLIYAFIYWFGIRWVRSIVFFVSMLGLLAILWQLV